MKPHLCLFFFQKRGNIAKLIALWANGFPWLWFSTSLNCWVILEVSCLSQSFSLCKLRQQWFHLMWSAWRSVWTNIKETLNTLLLLLPREVVLRKEARSSAEPCLASSQTPTPVQMCLCSLMSSSAVQLTSPRVVWKSQRKENSLNWGQLRCWTISPPWFLLVNEGQESSWYLAPTGAFWLLPGSWMPVKSSAHPFPLPSAMQALLGFRMADQISPWSGWKALR